jgi:hypothetical protein
MLRIIHFRHGPVVPPQRLICRIAVSSCDQLDMAERWRGPPPMKWSDWKYGYATEEDCNGEEAQA